MLGRVSSLRRRLGEGETVVGTFAKLPGADAAGALAGCGFDFAIVDREHSQLTSGEAGQLVRDLRGHGLPALVRLPAVDRGEVNRMLEAGADGIQLSTVGSVDEVERLRSSMRYAPHGSRSISLSHAAAGYGATSLPDYLASQQGEGAPLAVLQIETMATGDGLATIAAAGADVLFVGTTDLLVDAGLDAAAAADRSAEIVQAAAGAGIPWGGFAADAAAASELAGRGARYLVVGSDLALLRSGCAACLASLRESVHA